MKTDLLTHVVPTIPPQTGGAGEYALDLARQLRNHCAINSQFILCNPNGNVSSRIEDFPIRRLRFPNEARLWGMLASLKDKTAVLLHYEGCGYQRKGIPTWLYLGIKSWMTDPDCGSNQCHKQLFTVFHELWETSAKPWQGGFFLQIMQRRLVKRLHRRSQISITSCQHHQTQLDAIEPHKTLLLPISSGLPVIDRDIPGARRDEPLLVAIIDQHGSGSETIKAHANLLRTLDKTNRLAGAMLLGRSNKVGGSPKEAVALLQKSVSPRRIKVHENLDRDGLSQLLSRTDLLLLPRNGDTARKSRLLMAALAAGCAAVLRDDQCTAPLQAGKHFMASDDSPSSTKCIERMIADGNLERIAAMGQTWYQRYADWRVITRQYQEVLQTRVPVSFPEDLRLDIPLWHLPAPTR